MIIAQSVKMINMLWRSNYPAILSVFTEKEYRGQGISTRLMNDVVNYAKENKLCYIDLKATEEGYSLYKKIGFEERNQKYKDMRRNCSMF